uniref:F-box/kelch-repeat protein At3g23880-like n=1 Tax=Erigeron canadensis TaxID=72917 RepID=UPI001CB8BA27|nr:F-box/kelch-repeat protein At3g23880-like [Erigeron canadensis]
MEGYILHLFFFVTVKYVSIVDDDTFPHQKVSDDFVPDSVNKFRHDSIIVGTSHGLFCVYEEKTSTAVIWNPCIRKTVVIAVPNLLPEKYYWTVVGFGVCPRNLDPKLVKISYVSAFGRLKDVNASTQVEVFTLSSGGTWRSPLSINLPHISIDFGYSQAVVDGFIYWVAFDRIDVDDGTRNPKLIMSFNVTTEEFTKVNLPRPLALDPYADLLVSNLRESLAVLKFNKYTLRENCDVWMMNGHGCARAFNRLYSIRATDASLLCKTLGFRKSGAPIIESKNTNRLDYFYTNEHELAIYEPESKDITHIGIHGLEGKFFVHSYKETLLLLGQQ